MSLRKSVWKRETRCLTCETEMINYQYMTKSHTIVYDEWMIAHPRPLGEYETFPETLKTTICPCCFTASNEYHFGVDGYTQFTRNVKKNRQIQEMFEATTEHRFQLLAEVYSHFEEASALLDQKHHRPANTRTRATLEKVWRQKEAYGVPFFNLMFQEPRDFVTALVGFALDRYCQMLRILFNHEITPTHWDYPSLKKTIEEQLHENPLAMKAAEPRFYLVASNFLQSIQILQEMVRTLYDNYPGHFDDMLNRYWRDAYTWMSLSCANDDLSAVPCELKEGGVYLVMTRLYLRFGEHESAEKTIRLAKHYADNRLKRISSQTQQIFVNDVDDLYNECFSHVAAV